MLLQYSISCLVFITFVLKTTESLELTGNGSYYLNPDAGLNISQLLDKYGYPFESHTIETEDGYLLGLHRVPHGHQNSQSGINRSAVLIAHGMGSQSTDFVNGGPEKSLGYLLADRGYDVWLLNSRGNTHSRKHISLDPDKNKTKFWDFSWHEIGKYDVPKTIDYILNITKQEKLFYIGHSEGTTSFFVMTSLLPEYNSKIRHMSAMGPAALFSHNMDIKYRTLAKYYKELEIAAAVLNLHELFGHMGLYLDLVKSFCLEGMETYSLCEAVYVMGVGYSPTEFNMTMLPVIVSNSPSGFSVRQGFHYLQQFRNEGVFKQYDYGSIINMIKYGSPKAPNYNLTNVVAPITLHYSKEDQLVNYQDVEILATLLPNATKRMVPIEHFTHLDYLWGNNVKTLIYDYILEEMEKY